MGQNNSLSPLLCTSYGHADDFEVGTSYGHAMILRLVMEDFQCPALRD